MSDATVEAAFRHRLGSFELDATLTLPAHGVTGLFGPSGSGKTTVLRCLAGLERPRAGRLRMGSEVWQDEATGRFVPPHRRGVGYVFQDANLFPHLTVRDNLEFAWRRTPAEERRIERREVAEWLGLEELLDRHPPGLSGGERQRAALGRALAASPRLLLLDEPLSALDRVGRRQILPYLESLSGRLRIPTVYVSHDLAETARLADRLVWIVDGTIRAQGPVPRVVAGLDFARWRGAEAGVVADAVVEAHDTDHHLTRLSTAWGPLRVRRLDRSPGSRVRIQVEASDVSVGLAPDRGSSILNEFPLRVAEIGRDGPGEVLLRLERDPAGDGGDRGGKGTGLSATRLDPTPLLARITTLSAERLEIAAGRRVYARVKAVAVEP